MKTRSLIHLYAVVQSAIIALTSCQSFPVVSTPSGPIKGVVVPTLGMDIVQFRNIPYAKPPVGNLRFEKPLPVEPWTETLDGTAFGSACMQEISSFSALWKTAEIAGFSEDCLQLNIYVSETVIAEPKRSVMVWIHGGGFITGSAIGYDGSFLAAKDVIVVTVNYRLGIFGFLSTEDSTLPSNFGLWDIIEALKWVNENIASFGGDPESVTIFGESAGGFAVSLLAVIPSTEGLFHRIIFQSGPALAFMSISKNPARVTKNVGKLVGCLTGENVSNEILVNCLKEKTSDELLKAQSDPGTQYFGTFSLSLPIWPVVDGELITKQSLNALSNPFSKESNYFRSLDVLTGSTDNEGTLVSMFLLGLQHPMGFNITNGIPTSVLCDVIAPTLAVEMYHDHASVSDLICEKYSTDNLEQQSRNIINLLADAFIVSPTLQLLEIHAKDKTSPNTYQYLYTQTLEFSFPLPTFPWMNGAGHAAELVYMFGPTVLNDLDKSLVSEEGMAFTDILITYWTNFAKTGNPNGDGLVTWQPFDLNNRGYLELKYKPVRGHNSYKDRMTFLLQDIPMKIRNAGKTEL